MTICGRCTATVSDETALYCGICGAPLPRGADAAPATSRRPPAALDEGAAAAPEGGGPAAAPDGGEAGASEATSGAPEGGAAPAGREGAAAPEIPLAPPAGAPKLPKASKHLPVGALIDKKYAVLRVLGEGGMGVVYLARDVHTGLDVVVKAVRAELAHRDDVRARTLAEGRALAQIDHPNVVHLRAVAVEGPALYLVMQYIEGENLDRIIHRHQERGERMPVDEALGIFRQVCAGVSAAHDEGVIHRDLKPANVLLRKKDRVAKVTDFGIALVPSDTGRPHTRGILGSLWYMSPEQVTGQRDLDHRVDVYALGILLYQMLVGRVPFDAKSDYEIMKQHAEAPMPFVAAARPDVPPAVDELIQRATAKDRDRRFPRCEDLIQAVDRLLVAPLVPTAPAVTGPGSAPIGNATVPGAPVVPVLPPMAPPEPPAPTLNDAVSKPRAAAGGSDNLPTVPMLARPVWPWFVLGGVVVAGAIVAAVVIGGVGGGRGSGGGRPGASASAAGSGSAAPPRASGSAAVPRPEGLAALVGAWVGNGRELYAVLNGGDLEFRVKKPEQFAPQAYESGDARFVLRATGEAGVYTVEDRIRPVPPVGKTYDPRSRGTCQEVWTRVGNDPLRARFDGARLSVEFAKIEPGPGNFTTEGGKVTSCVGLHDLRASKVVSVLTRP